MEAASLWAGVRFTARNGSPEALLTDAAGQGLHLYGVFSLPGGFYGHCAAWQYRRLAALARHRRSAFLHCDPQRTWQPELFDPPTT